MHQDKLEQMTAHLPEPHSQDSLEVGVAADIRSFVANALQNDESVARLLRDAAFRSEVIDTLTFRAHGR